MSGFTGTGHDLRDAVRALIRNPLATTVILATLALGIGINVVVFGIVDRVLLSPPPGVGRAAELYRVQFELTDPDNNRHVVSTTSYPTFERLRAIGGDLAGVAAETSTEMVIGRGATARTTMVALVSENYFDVTEAALARGRGFGITGGGERVAVVSHRFWQRELGGASDVVGSTLFANGDPYTVIGVAAPGFSGHGVEPRSLWIPILVGMSGKPPGWHLNPDMRVIDLVCRVPPPADPQTVAVNATRVLERDGSTVGRRPDAWSRRVVLSSIVPGRDAGAASPLGRLAFWLGGVSTIVLLVALTNVLGLELLRSFRARRDNAVRLALGIGRLRLARSLLIESLLLTTVGAGVGLWAAVAFGAPIQRFMLPHVGAWHSGPGLRGLVLCAAVALLVGSLSGLVRFVQALRASGLDSLRSSGFSGTFRRSRLQTGLLVTQTALALVLLIGAGLFVGSLGRILDQNLGLDADHIVVAELQFHGNPGPAARNDAYATLLTSLGQLAEVEAAAPVISVPFGPHLVPPISVPGKMNDKFLANGQLPFAYPATSEYFTVMGVELRDGRTFDSRDVATSARVVIVNESMAQAIWPAERAVGRCMRVGFDPAAPSMVAPNHLPCREVVGVVSDSRIRRVRAEHEPTALQFYLPWEQFDIMPGPFGPQTWALVLRTQRPAKAVRAGLLREILSRAPTAAFAEVKPYRQMIDPQIEPVRLGAAVFSLFGGLALAMAAFGLYGAMSYSLSQRRKEMGVRMALGARAGQLAGLILRDVLGVVVPGAALGVVGAVIGQRWLETHLYKIGTTDPGVLGAALSSLLVATILACVFPTWKTLRTDPSRALRTD